MRDLRLAKFGDLSPEQIARRYKFGVSARAIRNSEDIDECNPQIETLDRLARLYGSTVGDLLAFTSSKDEGAMMADMRILISDPEVRKATRTLLSRIRLK